MVAPETQQALANLQQWVPVDVFVRVRVLCQNPAATVVLKLVAWDGFMGCVNVVVLILIAQTVALET